MAIHDIQTVTIKTEPCKGNPEGLVEINHFDYDPEVHTLADGQVAPNLFLPEGYAENLRALQQQTEVVETETQVVTDVPWANKPE